MTTLLGTWTVGALRRRSFLMGFASAMDLRGNTARQYRWRAAPGQADKDAVSADWATIGEDLKRAVADYAPPALDR